MRERNLPRAGVGGWWCLVCSEGTRYSCDQWMLGESWPSSGAVVAVVWPFVARAKKPVVKEPVMAINLSSRARMKLR